MIALGKFCVRWCKPPCGKNGSSAGWAVTLSWWDAVMRGGGPKDPGNLGLLWRAYRAKLFWAARITVIAASLVFLAVAFISTIVGMLNAQPANLGYRVEVLQRDTQDQEARLRGVERTVATHLATFAKLEEQMKNNTEAINNMKHVISNTQNGVLAGLVYMIAFSTKEFLKLIQERKK